MVALLAGGGAGEQELWEEPGPAEEVWKIIPGPEIRCPVGGFGQA